MNDAIGTLLQQRFLGNTAYSYGISALLFASVFAFLYGARSLLVWRSRKQAEGDSAGLASQFGDLIGGIHLWELFLVALYTAFRALDVPPALFKLLRVGVVVAVGVRLTLIIQGVAVFLLRRGSQSSDDGSAQTASALRSAEVVLEVALWAGALLFMLDNLGVNITAAVAGLGIGGIAVAMAAKEILGDLFSSFIIFADKPFKIGDFIIVGDMMGTVEQVGIKTTRIRSLGGEMLVFANSDLTSSRIRNYKLMQERRVVFGFGVVYQTPHEKLKDIPGVVREIVSAIDRTRLDRVHWKTFGPSSLDFEVVYYVLVGDYAVYMDIQQQINLELKRRFEEMGVEFAYPTQTLYVNKPAG